MRLLGWGLIGILTLGRLAADEPLGPRVGYDSGRLRLGEANFALAGSRLLDYTFGTAPTDWEPVGGTWEITSRYACEPEWSFFGGASRGVCSLWNKRALRGDLAVEVYVAFRHGLPWSNEAWHYIPSDLNLNLCSKRGDLASGYSFICSGRNGSTTMIRRGTRVLAQTSDPQFLVPQFLDVNPLFQQDADGKAFGQFHRHWWRLEARKVGQTLTLLVDGRQALEVTDPAVLDSGHLALWTVGSGMVVARVRVAYQDELRATAPQLVVDQPVPLPPVAATVAAR
ncbi:MAG: hypothetical protein IT204_18740 [Fimbriimonadaceae bacterium]|nr:hypothetical protein [Fimbriimonadaceae bacterium]